jgi:hypothetical protein
VRATRNAMAKNGRAGTEEAQAGRSLRPRKGVSYAQKGDSGYESDSQEDDESSADEDDAVEVWLPFCPAYARLDVQTQCNASLHILPMIVQAVVWL